MFVKNNIKTIKEVNKAVRSNGAVMMNISTESDDVQEFFFFGEEERLH